MNKIIGLAATFALFATTQAFAIFGVGAHYVMNTGSLKSDGGPIDLGVNVPGLEMRMEQESASGLQGLGFKLWIDILPVIDVEGTFNISATRYKSYIYVNEKEISLSYKPDAPYNMLPFDDVSPLFGVVSGDLSVTYPIDIPIPFIRPYLGGGVSYIASIPIVNRSFTQKIIDSSPELATALAGSALDPDAIGGAASGALVKALKDADYNVGIGGHTVAGLRFKLPVIPIAAYANVKYYFGGDTGSQFTQGAVFELGGGFAL